MLDVSSTYRSYATQERTFNYWVSVDGLEEAERESARPGTSQHQLGVAIDFGNIEDSFALTESSKWLVQNAAKYGWRTVMNFAGFISVNLGVMNLLPIPALDGGRIMFLIIEKIRGRVMDPEKEGKINFIFFAVLILFMLMVTFSDIKRMF